MYPARSTAACPWPLAWSPLRGCSTAAPAPVFSKGPLPHQHAIDATHFEASSCRGAVAMMHSARRRRGQGCGLGRFARLDVRRGLRRTRAGAGSGIALDAEAGLPRTLPRGTVVSALRAALAFAVFWLPCVFCVFLRARALVLQAAWRGVAGSCLVWLWRCF